MIAVVFILRQVQDNASTRSYCRSHDLQRTTLFMVDAELTSKPSFPNAGGRQDAAFD